ncbi:hypothetical protein B0H14DRAFT_3018174 [Mycena olivaceomarginata]|nr:hypothetical protein B0H14DRAFT_3018174 [Mycena olivaceomarginata]
MDLYAVLNLAPGESPAELKAAYHRALLATHPDKSNASPQPTPDIAAIKDTYHRPRPAQGDDAWADACRCGGAYAITGVEMDRGVHLVPSFGWAMSWRRRSSADRLRSDLRIIQ